MDYKLTTNELWMDYKVMDGNSCEWISFIIWSCSMLVFMAYFPFWHVYHIFQSSDFFGMVYEIVLSHMILWMVLIFFWGMWAHCAWSRSPIRIMFVYGITIGETNQQHSTWHDWKGDLLVGHLHICHLF